MDTMAGPDGRLSEDAVETEREGIRVNRLNNNERRRTMVEAEAVKSRAHKNVEITKAICDLRRSIAFVTINLQKLQTY